MLNVSVAAIEKALAPLFFVVLSLVVFLAYFIQRLKKDDEKEEISGTLDNFQNLPNQKRIDRELKPSQFLKIESVQKRINKIEIHSRMLGELEKLSNMDHSEAIRWHQETIEYWFKNLKNDARTYAREHGRKWTLVHKAIDSLDFKLGESDYDLTLCHDTDLGTYLEGDTRTHKDIIKTTGLRWKPSKKIWGKLKSVGYAPRTRAMTDIAQQLTNAGLTVDFRIEDASAQEYTEAKIIDMRERSERYQERAERTHAKADQSYQASKAISDRIPLGQPILVGHHSERSARADAKRIHSHMNKFVEHHQKANRQEAKAKNLETRAIFLEKHVPASAEDSENMNKNYTDMLELIKKKTKKFSPVVSQVKKTAEGKGIKKWAIYIIRFYSNSCGLLNLYVENNQLRVTIGHWGQSIVFNYEEGVETSFKKFEDFVLKYLKKNYKPVEYSNEYFHAKFDISSFCISDLSDKINEPRAISSRTSARDIAKVFKWSHGKAELFKPLTFSEMLSILRNQCGVSVHTYCAMD